MSWRSTSLRLGGWRSRWPDSPWRSDPQGKWSLQHAAGRENATAPLRILAQVTGVPDGRVAEVCDQVGLTQATDRQVGGYSLGMRQRLGLAGALLGDPPVLLLDEPANGLDPAGMAWLRGLLRDLADEGRTILLSSHALSEVAQTVDQVVIINQGRLRFAGPLDDLGDLEVSFLRLTDAHQPSLRTGHDQPHRQRAPQTAHHRWPVAAARRRTGAGHRRRR